MDQRPLQELTVGDHAVETVVVDEVVVHAVHLARTGSPGRRRDGDVDVGVAGAHVGGDGALADRGRPREHGDLRNGPVVEGSGHTARDDRVTSGCSAR